MIVNSDTKFTDNIEVSNSITTKNAIISGNMKGTDISYGNWSQLGAGIDGENGGDESGWVVSLSSDGTIVAIGTDLNDGNGNNSGHVRVYKWRLYTQADANVYNYETRIQSSSQTKPLIITESINTSPSPGNYYWTQLGTDIDGDGGDDCGFSISLSSDGTIVAIGGIGNDDNGTNSGHVRVYEYNGSSWIQVGADIDGEAQGDYSGHGVSLSSDGTIVAISATENDGNGGDVSSLNKGHVRVYKWRLYTNADANVYNYQSRTQNSNNLKPLIITESTNTQPSPGNYYWTQVGFDIDGENGYDKIGGLVHYH